MKLLCDENLPPSLVGRLASEYAQSASVLKIGMGSRPDAEIIAYAKTHRFTIVSKDADFDWHCVAHGAPPKVVWLRCGNVRPAALEDALRRAKPKVDAFEMNEEAFLILTNA